MTNPAKSNVSWGQSGWPSSLLETNGATIVSIPHINIYIYIYICMDPPKKKTPQETLTIFAVLLRNFHPLVRHSEFEHLTMPASTDIRL